MIDPKCERMKKQNCKLYGLYVVHRTYVTSQCAITMTTNKIRNLDLGLDVGATEIVKLGDGGSSLQKLKVKDGRRMNPKR
jgi:hypothetical protein